MAAIPVQDLAVFFHPSGKIGDKNLAIMPLLDRKFSAGLRFFQFPA
jgi:hypothetical protein